MTNTLKTKIQSQILILSLAAEKWEKGDKDPGWVKRDTSGRFSKNPSNSQKETVDSYSSAFDSTSSAVKSFFQDHGFGQEAKKKGQQALDLLDKDKAAIKLRASFSNSKIIEEAQKEPTIKGKLAVIKKGIAAELKEIKKNPKKAVEIAGNIAATAVPLGTYLGLVLGPDLLIGLALGDALPVILGGAAAYQGISFAANKFVLEPTDIKNRWVKAGIDIGISLLAANFTRSVFQAVKATKFGTTGIYELAKSGKSAEDLKAIAQALENQVGKQAKNTKDIMRLDKLKSALVSSVETAPFATANFFQDFATRISGSLKSEADKLDEYADNITNYAAKEFSDIPNLDKTLSRYGIDYQKLSERLVEMASIKNVPWFAKDKQTFNIKNFVQRVKEMAKADALANSAKSIKRAKQLETSFEIFGNKLTELGKIKNPSAGQLEQINELQSAMTDLQHIFAKDTRGAHWRASFIKSEIKYGKKIDEFLSQTSSEGFKEKYNSFIGSLSKSKNSNFKTTILSAKDTRKELESIAKDYGVDVEEIQPWTYYQKYINMAVKDAEKITKFYGQLVNKEMNISLMSFGQRAMARLGRPENVIDISSGGSHETIHEITHFLEFQDENKLFDAISFRQARALSEKMIDMAHLHMPGEVAIEDTFNHIYTGKVYPINYATEVYTTGMEKIATAGTLHKQAFVDREHLMFSLSVLE